MRYIFVAFGVLFSFLSNAAVSNIKSLDSSSKVNACVVLDVDSTPGRVACWGRNSFATFLDGNFQKAFAPILLPEFDYPVTQVVTGYYHACVLLGNGQVQCWGGNQFGQLGLNHFANAYGPTTVALPGLVSKIFGGVNNTCAQVIGGSIYCWGENVNGQLGLGHNQNVPAPTGIQFTNALSISFSRTSMCLVRAAGIVMCAGSNSNGGLGVSSPATSNILVNTLVTGATQVDVGPLTTCVTHSNGQVRCWGSGTSGAIGAGSNPAIALPTLVSNISTAQEVAVGQLSACARLADGTATCWGDNSNLSLGSIGANTNIPRAVTTVSNITSIEAGEFEFCTNQSTGSMTCWGRAIEGMLGDGGNARNRLNAIVNFDFTYVYNGFVNLFMGSEFTFGSFSNGTARSTGDNLHRQLGMGSTGQYSGSGNITTFSDTNTVAPTLDLQLGQFHTCSLRQDRSVECWGRNTMGQVGTTSPIQLQPDPVQLFAPGSINKIQALQQSNCALATGGTVICWGLNNQGQLGNGSTNSSSVAFPVLGLSNVTELYCSKLGHTCCAKQLDNTVKCWGNNIVGQMGIEPFNPYEVFPITASWGADVTKVAMGSQHSCYLNNLGKVFCFGANTFGMLGDGTTVTSSLPKEVKLPGLAVDVKIGNLHTCALLQDSRLYCWGQNTSSQVGGPTSDLANKPVFVKDDVIAYDLGGISTCALDSKKEMWCWGTSGRGSFGDGTTGNKQHPTRITYK